MSAPVGRLLAFAAFAALGSAHWARLLSDPPYVRTGIVAAIAVAAALGLRRVDLPGGRRAGGRHAGSVLLLLAALAAALAAIGVPGTLLLPWHWGELGAEIGGGLSALGGEISYPFDGGDPYSRVLLLAGLPVALLLAAALGFWPRAGSGARLGALVALVAALAIPATALPAAAPLLWGVLLLALAALWLWGPRMRAAAPLALVAASAAVAVPVASALEGGDPWLDYRGWRLSEAESTTSYRWEHEYGPIDWPRSGATLFRVRSEQPRYWRAQLLDVFDGRRWTSSPSGVTPGFSTSSISTPEPKTRWVERAAFRFEALETSTVISPGTPLGVQGLGGLSSAPGGGLRTESEPLGEGTEYSVSAYVPDPSARRMRSRSRSYAPRIGDHTIVSIPDRGVIGPDGVAESMTRISVPPFGSGGKRAAIEGTLEGSPYRRLGRLAERLIAGQPTAYDAVKAVEDRLRRGYSYEESPPTRRRPLAAFLFRDRIGYCQQFSGAMALMLRLQGIPARVATGFTPGTRERGGDDVFAVTDLDAHSWVEVYFKRIGWVPFDPTPSAAPARSQSGGPGVNSAALGAGAQGPDRGLGLDAGDASAASLVTPGGGAIPAWLAVALLGLALGPPLTAGVAAVLRARRHRGLPDAIAAELKLAELVPALHAGDRPPPPGLTLAALERRLRAERRPRAARYVAALRGWRYRPGGSSLPPGLAERRALRRELAAGSGLWARLRLLIAMPPGAPLGRRGAGAAEPVNPRARP